MIQLVYSVETVVPDINVKVDSSGKSVHKNETVGHFQSSPLDKEVITKHYSDVFTGIVLFQGEVKVHNDQNDVSLVYPMRRIPLTIRQKLKSELKRIEQVVGEHARCSRKNAPVNNASALICKTAHSYVRSMRTFDDILPQVSGAQFFTKLDGRSGYWVLKLDDESSFLWTFNTPFGRYRFRRLPFALKSSQDEFSKKIDKYFEDLSGVVIILDSILVFGSFRAD